jgi:hypothetical protein
VSAVEQAARPFYGAPVDPNDPLLRWWVAQLKARCPHFSHASELQTGSWYGLYVAGRLRAAMGFTYCTDRTIMVEYVVCEPSKAGRASMIVLMSALKEQWRENNIRFFCEVDNKKMRRITEALGAKPVAVMYQIDAEGRRG